MDLQLRAGAIVGVLSIPLLLATTPLHGQTVPYGFVRELAIGNPFESDPSAFAFLPDGRVLLTERGTGTVRLAAAGAAWSVEIHTIPNVSSQIERGLLGVAVDPEWPARPYLYFSYTRNDGTAVLAMYTASGALTNPASTSLTLSSPYSVLETPDLTGFHNGGTLRFGVDGKLYASLGDDGTPCKGQDLTILNGKILRLDVSAMPGPGSGPPPRSSITPLDNPFVAQPNENTKLVYNWGLRNPFRFTIDPLTGDLFVGDVGEAQWEEIDHVPAASHGSQNFGWPVREGPDPGPNSVCGAGNPFTSPIASYPHVPENPSAVIGGPLYRFVPGATNGLPASYDGSYFFADWGAGWITRLVLGTSGWEVAPPVPGQPSAAHWAEGLWFSSDFQEGPDGALYLMLNVGSWGLYRIRRVLPTSAALPAVASPFDVQPRPNPARAGSDVEFAWAAPRPGSVRLRVFDAAGRLVAERASAGEESRGVLRWNGRDVDGVPMPGGTYFYRLDRSDGSTAAGRVTLLR